MDLQAIHIRLASNWRTMLPDEIVAQLNSEYQCRENQIQHLAVLYTVSRSTNQTLHSANCLPVAFALGSFTQPPWPHSDWQILDLTILFPASQDLPHIHQRAPMHNRPASA